MNGLVQNVKVGNLQFALSGYTQVTDLYHGRCGGQAQVEDLESVLTSDTQMVRVYHLRVG